MAFTQSNIALKSSWQALAYFWLYRIILSGFFALLSVIEYLPEPLGSANEDLFIQSSYVFFTLVLASGIFIRLQKPWFVVQVTANIMIDVILLSVMMYSSAGLNSGFAMLIMIAVAAGSVLTANRLPFLYAAIATIAVILHEFYLNLFLYYSPNYSHAGFLGAAFFVVAVLSQLIGTRVNRSETLATEKAIEVQQLGELNTHIVQDMDIGVMVLDANNNIRLINDAAKSLFHVHIVNLPLALSTLSLELNTIFLQAIAQKQYSGLSIHTDKGLDAYISIKPLPEGAHFRYLIYFEDAAELQQEAQRMKLASLGHLTASIAHEIRNPLGAISHAGQLLSESEDIKAEDQRLTQIIKEHSIRINNIIQNVLDVGRKKNTIVESINIVEWLTSFSKEFVETHALNAEDIAIQNSLENGVINFDLTQLHQVFSNLSENALRYSKKKPLLILTIDIDDRNRVYVDIKDTGQGIEKEIEGSLFEPFFTTENQGTGLGLYIAKQLCEVNQAQLLLQDNKETGCIFRILFSSRDK